MAMHLQAPRWFGWQMLPGYTGARCVPWFSPIHVSRVAPLKTGQGLLELEFLHALYAEGVQDFTVRLKVLHRAENFMVGRIMKPDDTDRIAVISPIEFEWLEQFCPELIKTFPPDTPGNRWGDSVSAYLDSVFLQTPPFPAQPADPNDGIENEWLTACALRFDGYACAAALGLDEQPALFCRNLLAGRMRLETTEERMTAMFMLQRFLMKEGVRSKTDAGWNMFRELFLELASAPIPTDYRGFYYTEWQRNFDPVLPAGMALIRHLHQTTLYDVNSATSSTAS